MDLRRPTFLFGALALSLSKGLACASRSLGRRSISKALNPYADRTVTASVSVNRKNPSNCSTTRCKQIESRELRKRVTIMVTLSRCSEARFLVRVMKRNHSHQYASGIEGPATFVPVAGIAFRIVGTTSCRRIAVSPCRRVTDRAAIAASLGRSPAGPHLHARQ